jgi:hypothetical protein
MNVKLRPTDAGNDGPILQSQTSFARFISALVGKGEEHMGAFGQIFY